MKSQKKCIAIYLFFFLLFCLYYSGFADLYPAQFQIPQITKAPKLDGELQKGEWEECQEISDFVFWTLDRYEMDPVTAYLGFDKENLYVAFRSTYSDPETWKEKYEEKQPVDSHLWGRNNVSVQLSNSDVSIHLMAAPSLSRADYKNGDMTWNGDWEFTTRVNNDHWIAEIMIPFSDLDLKGPPLENMWDLTLGRTHPADARDSRWHGKVSFTNSASIQAQINKWPIPLSGDNQLEFQIENPSNKDQIVSCEIEIIPFRGKPDFINQHGQGPTTQFILPIAGAPVHFKRTMGISPGDKRSELITYDLPEEGSYYATATCYEEGGGVLIRNRGFWFSITPNKERLQELTRLVSEGIASCRKTYSPIAKELTFKGKSMLEELTHLSLRGDSAWKSKTWDSFTNQVDQKSQEVHQYLNNVRYASYFNWEINTAFGVTTTHSMNKIRRDDIYKEPMIEQISISAARNEYESFQVVVLPFGSDIQNIVLSPTDLISGDGNIISKSATTISFVDYNLIDRQPNYLIDYEGWYPDPLMPVEAPINIDGNEISRPFWITVYIPQGTPPGNYTGSIIIAANRSDSHTISVDLKVWDFEIPTEAHLKTHTWDNIELLNQFYNVEEIPVEWYMNFCEVLLKNHLSPGFAGINFLNKKPDDNGKFDFSNVGKVLEFCMERGLTRYSIIQMRKGFYTSEEEKEVYHFIHEYANFLRDKGWLDKGVVEVWDEPTIVRLPAVIQRAKDLRAMDPDLRLQLFAFGHKEFDFWKPEAKKYGLVDLIDVWSPWPLIESPESQANGTEIWSYFCTLARSNAPNFYIESPAIYQRSIAWHSWMFGVDAFEHWSTNYFWRNTQKGKSMNEKWPNRRWDSRTYMDFHGEGQLVYPGPNGRCIPSMRLEIFRDGMDDYEYLHRLRALIDQCEQRKVNIDLISFKQLVKVEEYLLIKYPEDYTATQENTIRYPDQPQRFIEVRNKLATAIEELQEMLK